MEVDFVTYQISVKLKEKGFPQNMCNDEYGYITSKYDDEYDIGEREVIWYIPIYLPYIAAPTIAQALKWLRKEKSLYIVPCVIKECDTNADGRIINRFTFWSFDISLIENGDIIYSENESIDDRRFNSYEEAALAGIEYVLDNLI